MMRLATEITEPHQALLRPVEQPAPKYDHSGWIRFAVTRGDDESMGVRIGATEVAMILTGRRRVPNKLDRIVSTGFTPPKRWSTSVAELGSPK